MTKPSAVDVLALFDRASNGDLDLRQTCLGQVEKALKDAPNSGDLLACKAALLVLVAARSAEPELTARYLRVAQQILPSATEDMPPQPRGEAQLMNGLAWAQIGTPVGDEIALRHLIALAQGALPLLEPIDQLAAWVGLSALYQDAARLGDSHDAFVAACQINRAKAISAFEALVGHRS